MKDASSEGFMADAVTTKTHLSLLIPTSLKIRSLQSHVFGDLRIKVDSSLVNEAAAALAGIGSVPLNMN